MKKYSQKLPPKPKLRVKSVIIEGKDFILECENCIDGYSEFPHMSFFDLSLPKTVNKGKSNERTELKWVSFCSLTNAIDHIAYYRTVALCKGQSFEGKGDEGLAQFLKIFREERNKVINLFDKTNEEWMNLFVCDKKKKSFKAKVE